MKGWHKEKRFGNYDQVARLQLDQNMIDQERMFKKASAMADEFNRRFESFERGSR